MWAGLRVEISCFSTTSTDALNMVGTAVQPVIDDFNDMKDRETLLATGRKQRRVLHFIFYEILASTSQDF